MKRFWMMFVLLGGLFMNGLPAQERLPEYLQAEKFTSDKLRTICFAVKDIPHRY